MRSTSFSSETTETSLTRKHRWFGRAESTPAFEIFGPAGVDASWIRRAFDGLKIDREQTHSADAAMSLDLMLAHGISINTDPFEPGARTPAVVERFYSQRFSATTRAAFERAFDGVERPLRGIICLHNAAEIRMLNFVHRPGEAIWYLDAKAGQAWHADAHEVSRLFDRYHPGMVWLLTNKL